MVREGGRHSPIYFEIGKAAGGAERDDCGGDPRCDESKGGKQIQEKINGREECVCKEVRGGYAGIGIRHVRALDVEFGVELLPLFAILHVTSWSRPSLPKAHSILCALSSKLISSIQVP